MIADSINLINLDTAFTCSRLCSYSGDYKTQRAGFLQLQTLGDQLRGGESQHPRIAGEEIV